MPRLVDRTADVRRWTGVAALAVAALLVTEFFVRLFMGDRPDLDDREALAAFTDDYANQTLVKIMIDLFLMTAMIVLFGGFRQVITEARRDLQWIADIAFGAGTVFVAITLVADALEAGSALDAIGMDPDPSAIRALTEGYTLMFGATGCVLIALIAAASGYVTLLSGALPAWTGWVAIGVAVTNLLAVPTMFGGTSTDDFWSAGGVGVALIATFPFFAWAVVVGIVTIRGTRHHERRRDQRTAQTQSGIAGPGASGYW
ncbi:hypothetical protein BH09ACT3_BH09ACT3_00450 [soil metagenome]